MKETVLVPIRHLQIFLRVYISPSKWHRQFPWIFATVHSVRNKHQKTKIYLISGQTFVTKSTWKRTILLF